MTRPQVGDRVMMTGVMPNDPAPLPVGAKGTVTQLQLGVGQIYVAWDNGSRLILLAEDPYEVIGRAPTTSPPSNTNERQNP